MRSSRIGACVLLIALLSSLSACGDGGMTEVKEWMAKTKAETRVSVPKLVEPKKFTPYAYADQDAVDPFNQSKLTVALQKMQANIHSKLAPVPHPHGPLENYPLDAIAMVGSVNKGGPHAILLVDKTVYDVKVGEYLGQNDGKIEAITDTEVKISERVQDASGEWVERKTSLELQEAKK
jgi:type IV pilus assembly protein PilP